MQRQRATGETGRGSFPGRVRAFTLVELLVVIAVLGLLVALLAPSLSLAFSVARDAVCKNHLSGLGQAMHGSAGSIDSRSPYGLPIAGGWVEAAVGFGSKDLLVCPEDEVTPGFSQSMDSLKNYYILQKGHDGTWRISNVGALLMMNDGVVEDGQVVADGFVRTPPAEPTAHTAGHPCYCGIPVRRPNQRLICICAEGRVLITFSGGKVTMESIIGCMSGAGTTASDHYLMKGNATNGARSLQDDTLILRLGGKTCTTVDPRSPYSFHTERSSYGMSSLVAGRVVGSKQIMIMDANLPEVVVGEPGWMDHVRDRHFGKVNYVTTGGSVHSITKAELMREYDWHEDQGDEGGSLWGTHATPGAKD